MRARPRDWGQICHPRATCRGFDAEWRHVFGPREGAAARSARLRDRSDRHLPRRARGRTAAVAWVQSGLAGRERARSRRCPHPTDVHDGERCDEPAHGCLRHRRVVVGPPRSTGLARHGALLAASALVGMPLHPFFPMHLRGVERTISDTMHIVLVGVSTPLTLGAMGFGAAALGRRFRVYSIVSWSSSSCSGSCRVSPGHGSTRATQPGWVSTNA